MPDVQIREQRYRDERPAEHFTRYHERTRSREPEAHIYELVRVLTVLNALIAFRARSIGSENVPDGPVILAPNHASFMDHFFSAGFIRRRVQFMAKSQLFAPGPAQYIFSHGGVFPVRRGVADEEAFTSAFAVLERGGPVAILGSHQARNWRRGRLPKVIVRYGTPFRFAVDPAPTRERQQQCADAILERIRVMHTEMVRLGARGTLRAARRGELGT